MSDEIFLYTLIWVADNTHFLHFLKVPGVISTGLNIFWSQEQEVRSTLPNPTYKYANFQLRWLW